MIKVLLRLEDLLIFLGSLYFYYKLHADWLFFIIFLFAIDVSMIGYLRSKKLGSMTYNLFHNYALGLVIIFVGLLQGNDFVSSIGLIFTAHVGMDRGVLGMGLKYSSNFKDTHLQKI